MRLAGILAVLVCTFTMVSCGKAQQQPPAQQTARQPAVQQAVLIDDFEFPVSGGFEGTVDFGAGNGSAVNVTAATDIKNTGAQSLKVEYDSIQDGYIWVARGFGLDAKNTAWLVDTATIDWKSFNAFSFFMYGTNSKAQLAFDIKDSGNEIWRFMTIDDFTGWKEIVAPIAAFSLRDDWQPDNADKNAAIDFPVKSYQFEPRTIGKGTWYFDTVKLIQRG